MLSVIVPVYNAGKYLPRCLDSLLNQGVQDYEVICVNDGSTDDSIKVLKAYTERYPEVVRVIDQTNGGVSKARNVGMDAAQGDVIAFCDADDYLVPGAYNYLLENYWRDDMDVLKYNSVTLDAQMLKVWEELENVSGKIVFKGVGHEFYSQFRPCFVWSNLYRKSFLDQHHLRFGCQGYAEDITFSLDLCMSNPRCVVIDANVYRYTISDQQLTRCRSKESVRRMVNDLLVLFRKMNDYAVMYQDLKPALEEHKEQLMLSCISRVLSADYEKKDWLDVKDRLHQAGVLPMLRMGWCARFINYIMLYYSIYTMAGVFYRYLFVPYVLPYMSRN